MPDDNVRGDNGLPPKDPSDILSDEAKRAIRSYMFKVAGSDQGEILSEDGKREIRSYMIRVATPSAVVLSIVSAIVGFGLNSLARGEAYSKAYGEAAKTIVEIAASAADSKSKTETLLGEARKTGQEIATWNERAKALIADAKALTDKETDAIADKLISRTGFLTKAGDAGFAALAERVSTIELNLGRISNLKALVKSEEKSGKLGYGTAAVSCSSGNAVVGLSIGGENFTLHCGPVLPSVK